jgi:hypothetical protein
MYGNIHTHTHRERERERARERERERENLQHRCMGIGLLRMVAPYLYHG